MSNAKTKPLLTHQPEASVNEAAVTRLLHDVKNQLGGLKLYATFLKNSLANNTLDRQEGIEVCDKIMQQIDVLTTLAKEAARHAPVHKS